jgi:hypothetical protein
MVRDVILARACQILCIETARDKSRLWGVILALPFVCADARAGGLCMQTRYSIGPGPVLPHIALRI